MKDHEVEGKLERIFDTLRFILRLLYKHDCEQKTYPRTSGITVKTR